MFCQPFLQHKFISKLWNRFAKFLLQQHFSNLIFCNMKSVRYLIQKELRKNDSGCRVLPAGEKF